MKRQSYQQVTYKTTKQTKEYIYMLAMNSKRRSEIEYIACYCMDIDSWKREIKKEEELQIELLSLLKEKIKTLDKAEEIEEALVYMNIIFPYHEQLANYKWQLLLTIMKHKDKDINCYCLVRHLIYKSQANIREVIELLATNQSCSQKQYHMLALEIYCLERKHKDAKEHVKALSREELQEYREELITTNPIMYWKLIRKAKREGYVLQLGGN